MQASWKGEWYEYTCDIDRNADFFDPVYRDVFQNVRKEQHRTDP